MKATGEADADSGQEAGHTLDWLSAIAEHIFTKKIIYTHVNIGGWT